MALTAMESILLTLAILGSVHLLLTLLQKLENEDTDCRDIMKEIAKYRFLKDPSFSVNKRTLQFYH